MGGFADLGEGGGFGDVPKRQIQSGIARDRGWEHTSVKVAGALRRTFGDSGLSTHTHTHILKN